MSWIWEPWKSLITNFLSRSVLVKSVLRLNQNFICPPWIIIEPEKKKEILEQTRLKRCFDPWMDFAYSLKQKMLSYEILLRMEWGRGGGGAGGYIISESLVSGIEEKANSMWIFYHIKKLYLWLSSSLSQFPRIFIHVLCQSLICLNLLFQGHIALQNYILTGSLQCFLNLLHILTNVIYYNYLYY